MHFGDGAVISVPSRQLVYWNVGPVLPPFLSFSSIIYYSYLIFVDFAIIYDPFSLQAINTTPLGSHARGLVEVITLGDL